MWKNWFSSIFISRSLRKLRWWPISLRWPEETLSTKTGESSASLDMAFKIVATIIKNMRKCMRSAACMYVRKCAYFICYLQYPLVALLKPAGSCSNSVVIDTLCWYTHKCSPIPRSCSRAWHSYSSSMQPALGLYQDICRYISISIAHISRSCSKKPHTCHNKHTLSRAFSSQPAQRYNN